MSTTATASATAPAPTPGPYEVAAGVAADVFENHLDTVRRNIRDRQKARGEAVSNLTTAAEAAAEIGGFPVAYALPEHQEIADRYFRRLQERERPTAVYPKRNYEYPWHFLTGDPDRKWGPFYPWVRAARMEGRWREWNIRDIVRRAPEWYTPTPPPPAAAATGPYRIWEELRDDVRPAHMNIRELLGRETLDDVDLDDNFFETHFRALYIRTVQFVARWFDGRLDLGAMDGSAEIWKMHMTDQFVEYARIVAHEDRDQGGWPIILNNGVQRRWLIVGMLAQVMEKKIFNELLFGCDEQYQEDLQRLDTRWIDHEGYGRKAERAINARRSLEDRLLPHEFWDQVDDLAAKTVKIFLPLLNVLKELVPVTQDEQRWYTQEQFLQEIHILLSYAGLLQVCMAVSPSIFHFLSATPGARMDYQLERQADMGPYRSSKQYYETLDRRYRDRADKSLKGEDPGETLPDDPPLPKDERERRAQDYHRLRGAKVKFAVFPKVTRYRPVNVGKGVPPDLGGFGPDDPDGDQEQRDIEGQSVVDISECMVIYYQGLIYPPANTIEAIPLEDHRRAILSGWIGLIPWIAWLLLAVIRRASLEAYKTALRIMFFVFWFAILCPIYLGRRALYLLGFYYGIPILFVSFFLFRIAKEWHAQGYPQMGWWIRRAVLLTVSGVAFYYYVTDQLPERRFASEDRWQTW